MHSVATTILWTIGSGPAREDDSNAPRCAHLCDALLVDLPIAIAIVDDLGVVQFANEAAARALGRARDALAGADVADALCPLADLLAAAGDAQPTVAVRSVDGSHERLACTVTRIAPPQPGGPGLLAVVLHDTTGAPSSVSERNRVRRLASMGAAVPTVIHKVKNSLAAATIGLELLEHGSLDAELQTRVRGVLTETRNVASTLDGFGAVAGDLRASVAVELEPMLEDARLLVDEQADEAGVCLEWLVDRLPPLPFDPAVVHALLFHLVCDAFRCALPGDTVRVDIHLVRGRLVIDVSDTGNGHRPGSRHAVPLTLCKEAAESAGGTLSVEHDARGTRRIVCVPREEGRRTR